MKRSILFLVLVSLLLVPTVGNSQQIPNKPFILPMASSPGPSTWFFGQTYGNTTGAFNFGDAWYSAGQGLHFGLDFSMPCGTPLVAVADGEVAAVSSASFGAGPHNLLLRHPDLQLVTLYGHLLERPTLVVGQPIRQGDVIALSGDPDAVCDSRPHLHFEVRSLDFRTAYNPVDYIEAPWHSLVGIGPFSNPMFQQDMDNPRRWMSIDDQPEVQFGGVRLNDYHRAWPYPLSVRPPVNTELERTFDRLPQNTEWNLRQVGFGRCCAGAWWNPLDANRYYLVDGPAGQRANVFEYTLDNSAPPTITQEAPPMLASPDGTYQVTRVNGQVTIRNLADASEWVVQTQGFLPAVNPSNDQLMWEVWRGNYVPGEVAQIVETWVSDLDGANARRVWRQSGGYAVWLDETRLLISSPEADSRHTTLTVFDTADDTSFELGRWNWLREVRVAPGGGRIMFNLTWQDDPNDNGIYTLETRAGAETIKMPWYGGWRWRDADSVYYIPFDPSTSDQILAYFHIPSQDHYYLTDGVQLPFTIANADWRVAPDGQKILFRNARDMNLWILELVP